MEEAKVEVSEEERQQETLKAREGFRKEIDNLLNRHCRENGSDTPDFILAEYLVDCLEVFDKATRRRTDWYSDRQHRLQETK